MLGVGKAGMRGRECQSSDTVVVGVGCSRGVERRVSLRFDCCISMRSRFLCEKCDFSVSRKLIANIRNL